MNNFSKDEANYLVNYYSEKVLGKLLDGSTRSKVKSLGVEQVDDNRFRVMAFGTTVMGSIIPRKSLEPLLKNWEMDSMDEVLSRRSLM